MKCRSCKYDFNPEREGNREKRKCGMCVFGDTYSVRNRKDYNRNLLEMVVANNNDV